MNDFEKWEPYFPLAIEWAKQQEEIILERGVELSEDQKIDAYLIGVQQIEKVRLLAVDKIPVPPTIDLQKAGLEIGLLTGGAIGVTYQYGIYIQKSYWTDRKLVAHELVHVMQYEKLGGRAAFLREYLKECILLGYPNGPLEQEADQVSKEICRQ